MKKLSDGIAAIFTVFLLAICIYFLFETLNNRITEHEINTNEFYSVQKINKSMIDINLTDNSCILLNLDSDTLWIISNNVECIIVDKNNHILTMFYHDDTGYITKELQLDTLYEQNISEIKFKNK